MDTNRLQQLYKLLGIWSLLSLAVFALIGGWGLAVYMLLFVGVFGTAVFRYRSQMGRLLAQIGFRNTWLFAVLVIVTVLFEEYLIYFLVGVEGIMNPNLLINMILISTFWLSWLLTWKLYLAKRYFFTEKEAIMTAGLSGVLFEIVGPLKFLDPAAVLFITPLSVFIYATAAILPMQLVGFVGQKTGGVKYLAGVFLPFLAAWPAALLVYVILTSLGYSL